MTKDSESGGRKGREGKEGSACHPAYIIRTKLIRASEPLPLMSRDCEMSWLTSPWAILWATTQIIAFSAKIWVSEYPLLALNMADEARLTEAVLRRP